MQSHLETAEPSEISRRACDQCRTRKVRCDRQTPCSNCTTAKQHCSFTGAGQRPRQPRQRVLITSQYEKKIDHLEHRLGRIEAVLNDIAQSQHRREESPTGTLRQARMSGILSSLSTASTPSASCTTSESNPKNVLRSGTTANEGAFEGNSSVTAHATFASEYLEHAFEQPSLQHAKPELRAALSSFRQLLELQRQGQDIRFERQKQLGNGGLRDLPMPPLDVILKLLRELKEKIPQSFTLFCALTSVEYFTEHCRMIYFATEDFSLATFVIVNTGLYFILQEKAALAMNRGDKEASTTLQTFSNLCRDNIETALGSLNLLMPARKENVEALVMGASYAIEISKPSLAWPLNTAACQVALSLGYHRSTRLPGESEDAMRRRSLLFWAAYILDKALALRLGRPSILQDYDITLSRRLEPVPEFGNHIDNMQSWLRHAEVQGRMYQELFSPGAMLRPVDQRVKTAQECAQILLHEGDRLYRVRKRFGEGNGEEGEEAQIAAMLLRSDEVAILSSLTLIYRTIPPEDARSSEGTPTTFSHDCIFIARKAMDLHLECIRMTGSNHMLAPAHVHWSVSFTPFIPFIVLFCHVLEVSDMEDLERIKSFMTSLEPWTMLSEHIERLFHLCQVLYKIAVLCVETRKSQRPRPSQSRTVAETTPVAAIGSFGLATYSTEMELSAFEDSGVSFGSGTNMENQAQTMATAASQTSQMEDWFSGYMNIVGLSEFSLPNWPEG